MLHVTGRADEIDRAPSLFERVRNAPRLSEAHEKALVEAVRHVIPNRRGHTAQRIADAVGISRERAYWIMAGRR